MPSNFKKNPHQRSRADADLCDVPPSPRSSVDKRRHARHARRIACELWIDGARSTGIVKDVSRSGVFVQTRARAMPGTALTLVIAAGEGRTEIRVRGKVSRAERIQAHLATQSAAGLGVEVLDPGGFGRLLGDLRLTTDSEEVDAESR